MRKIILVIPLLNFWLVSFSKCTVQLPINQTIYTNGYFTITTTLETRMNSTSYEWFRNGLTTSIVGETNATLVVINKL